MACQSGGEEPVSLRHGIRCVTDDPVEAVLAAVGEQVFMYLKGADTELHVSFTVKHGEGVYVVFASTDSLRCFECGDIGHKRFACPHQEDRRQTRQGGVEEEGGRGGVAEENHQEGGVEEEEKEQDGSFVDTEAQNSEVEERVEVEKIAEDNTGEGVLVSGMMNRGRGEEVREKPGEERINIEEPVLPSKVVKRRRDHKETSEVCHLGGRGEGTVEQPESSQNCSGEDFSSCGEVKDQMGGEEEEGVRIDECEVDLSESDMSRSESDGEEQGGGELYSDKELSRERAALFSQISIELDSANSDTILVLGGDWNCTIDPSRDW
ncbi:hypothetical protein LDENG_00035020, partial [Lucifuga dentata]